MLPAKISQPDPDGYQYKMKVVYAHFPIRLYAWTADAEDGAFCAG